MSQSTQEILIEDLKAECHRLNIELIGTVEIVGADGQLATWYEAHSERFQSWLERGAHGDMEWLVTQADKRCDPRLLLPEVRTGIALWIGHHFPLPQELISSMNQAKVARYAWGRDYHNVLRRVLRQLHKWLKQLHPEVSFHGSVDTSPVLERAIAEQCGIGWIGKSTMLIHPKKGTFGSIAIALSSASFTSIGQKAQANRCGTCTACIDECPTQALGPDGLDARKCISYWTIEHRGVIPESMRKAIGDWVFGCDICQDYCPWTMKAAKTQDPPSQDLWLPKPERARPDLLSWLAMSDEELNLQLQGSPLRRAFPHGLKRNAMIVLVNQKSTQALPLIIEQLDHGNVAVRVTALWAARELLSLCLKLNPELTLLQLKHQRVYKSFIKKCDWLKNNEESTLVLKELSLTEIFLSNEMNIELNES